MIPVYVPKELQVEFIMGVSISAEYYEEMLGAVPPVRLLSNGFLVGEIYDHVKEGPRYQMFFERGDQYFYAGLSTVEDFDLWTIPSNERYV